MTAVSDRVAFKELSVDTLQAHYLTVEGMEGVTCHFGAPGENKTDEMVIFGTIAGNSTAVVFGPAGNDDEFTIEAEILTFGHDTEIAAAQRAQLLLNELNAALFQTRYGVALGGRAFPGKQDGPNADPPLDGKPAAGLVELTIGCAISVRGA